MLFEKHAQRFLGQNKRLCCVIYLCIALLAAEASSWESPLVVIATPD